MKSSKLYQLEFDEDGLLHVSRYTNSSSISRKDRIFELVLDNHGDFKFWREIDFNNIKKIIKGGSFQKTKEKMVKTKNTVSTHKPLNLNCSAMPKSLMCGSFNVQPTKELGDLDA